MVKNTARVGGKKKCMLHEQVVMVRNPSEAGGSRTHTLQDRAVVVRNPGEVGETGIKKTQTCLISAHFNLHFESICIV